MTRPKKWRRVLRILASGARLTRFDAPTTRDWTLPQTIARIKAHGVPVQVEMIEVPGYEGCPTRCARYSLNAEGYAAAERILNAAEVGE